MKEILGGAESTYQGLVKRGQEGKINEELMDEMLERDAKEDEAQSLIESTLRKHGFGRGEGQASVGKFGAALKKGGAISGADFLSSVLNGE